MHDAGVVLLLEHTNPAQHRPPDDQDVNRQDGKDGGGWRKQGGGG